MKSALFTIFLLLFCAANIPAQDFYGSTDVERFREWRDKAFRDPSLTPLMQEDFANFQGLKYYEADDKYAVTAKLEKTTDAQVFMMPTSAGTSRKYFKYGVLKFELDGKSYVLSVFQSETAKRDEYKKLLFIPFRDRTNGKETYGAGRYLDIKTPSGEEVILNFNLAYNMSCAYGREEYSCTIPPKENFLEIEIRAGEKIYPHAVKK